MVKEFASKKGALTQKDKRHDEQYRVRSFVDDRLDMNEEYFDK